MKGDEVGMHSWGRLLLPSRPFRIHVHCADGNAAQRLSSNLPSQLVD